MLTIVVTGGLMGFVTSNMVDQQDVSSLQSATGIFVILPPRENV